MEDDTGGEGIAEVVPHPEQVAGRVPPGSGGGLDLNGDDPLVVGEAITGYLRRGRPATDRRELFLRTLAPIGPITSGAVSQIVRRACARAGVAPIGAHRLRHTLACELVGAGAGLSEVA